MEAEKQKMIRELVAHSHTGALANDRSGVYAENSFNDLLRFERKRVERSGSPFSLVLVDISHSALQAQNSKFWDQLAQTLSTVVRETDIVGWYRRGAMIGVICLDVNDDDAEIRKILFDRIAKKLSVVLNSHQLKRLEISFHSYPQGSPGHTITPDLYLYPELQQDKKKTYNQAKRLLDITGSIGGILLFSPLFLVIPVLIKLTSGGPVLFRQKRVGYLGKEFTLYKFRTMHVGNDTGVHEKFVKDYIANNSVADAKEGEKVIYKLTNDPRVTALGRFLRKTSFDEIPQFFNVFVGDMSLVGPRPPIPYEVEIYDPWHKKRILETRPGITGLWQVNDRSTATFDEMVRLDIKYARESSLWLDLKILIKTPFAVFFGKGAY